MLSMNRLAKSVEESVIQTVKKFGVEGTRSDVNTGVWVKENKLSAVGISATRWISYHGTSINIDCDMKYYDNIVPCGITVPGRGVCRLRDIMTAAATSESLVDEVKKEYLDAFGRVYHAKCEVDSVESLDSILSQYPTVSSSHLTRL
jgi:lipoyl(octanoyl) transferase